MSDDDLAGSTIAVSERNSGYLHPLYADSFSEFGDVLELPQCGGWVLQRSINSSSAQDATGLYPLFCCQDWQALKHDVDNLRNRLVSLVIVADPFGSYTESDLKAVFSMVTPYKKHYVADTTMPVEAYVSKSHRANARRALRKVDVEVCPNPSVYLDDWVGLYATLSGKHDIRGLSAFSIAAFEKQLRVPGIVMFRASQGGVTVGLDLWYVQGEVAQGHLVAMSSQGYSAGASYATKWAVLDYFKDKVPWVNFGGVPGPVDSTGSGLGHFKAGWSCELRISYLCGEVLDDSTYSALSAKGPITDFFPAYRAISNP